MLANRRKLFAVAFVTWLGASSSAQAFEPIQDQNDGNGQKSDRTRLQQSQSDQVVSDNSGNDFMEEVPDKNAHPTQPAQPIKIDLGNVGVSVDSNGKIIPLINRGGPAVVPFSTQFEQSVQPLAPYGYGYGAGYGFGSYPYPYPATYGFNGPAWRRYPYQRPDYQLFSPYVQRDYSFQQRTVLFTSPLPWFAPPAPPPLNQTSGSSAIDPFF